jgi:hypothetical protein
VPGTCARRARRHGWTNEGFYWPTVPADVVASARAFRDRLADPNQLAAYKAMLPPGARGDGVVNVHHLNAASNMPFAAAASYDVVEDGRQLGRGSVLSFDPNAQPVTTVW